MSKEMSFQLLFEDWQGSSIPDGGGKIIPQARNGERECSGEGFWAINQTSFSAENHELLNHAMVGKP